MPVDDFSCDNTLSTFSGNDEEGLSIYPNPVKSTLFIEAGEKYMIYSVDGVSLEKGGVLGLLM